MTPRFDVATLFVEMCQNFTDQSIIGRAQEAGAIAIQYHNIRDWAGNKHGRVDDTLYGGGKGMLLQAQPVYACWEAICQEAGQRPHVIYPSPQGQVFTQDKARELSQKGHVMFLCGHYEGIDQRVLDEIVDEELSLGDFVMTGGELAAMAMLDAVARLLPGVLAEEVCFTDESHWDGLLEHPQYTHPALWRNREVPPVLLTGHHANITRWRKDQSILNTLYKRPDLLGRAPMTKEDLAFLQLLIDQNLPRVLEEERQAKAARKEALRRQREAEAQAAQEQSEAQGEPQGGAVTTAPAGGPAAAPGTTPETPKEELP